MCRTRRGSALHQSVSAALLYVFALGLLGPLWGVDSMVLSPMHRHVATPGFSHAEHRPDHHHILILPTIRAASISLAGLQPPLSAAVTSLVSSDANAFAGVMSGFLFTPLEPPTRIQATWGQPLPVASLWVFTFAAPVPTPPPRWRA